VARDTGNLRLPDGALNTLAEIEVAAAISPVRG
jgi:hypothetical protein